ncbi:hypothetical protein [Nonomuraea sp. NPDC052265]|uniref:hypothetical protein n=1 Tax=Nonomuraea sp. NPDC052265 TaxID=3364374 RepID=UPI0037C5592E
MSPLLAPPVKAAGETVNDATFVFCQDYALPVRGYRDWDRMLRPLPGRPGWTSVLR